MQSKLYRVIFWNVLFIFLAFLISGCGVSSFLTAESTPTNTPPSINYVTTTPIPQLQSTPTIDSSEVDPPSSTATSIPDEDASLSSAEVEGVEVQAGVASSAVQETPIIVKEEQLIAYYLQKALGIPQMEDCNPVDDAVNAVCQVSDRGGNFTISPKKLSFFEAYERLHPKESVFYADGPPFAVKFESIQIEYLFVCAFSSSGSTCSQVGLTSAAEVSTETCDILQRECQFYGCYANPDSNACINLACSLCPTPPFNIDLGPTDE